MHVCLSVCAHCAYIYVTYVVSLYIYDVCTCDVNICPCMSLPQIPTILDRDFPSFSSGTRLYNPPLSTRNVTCHDINKVMDLLMAG